MVFGKVKRFTAFIIPNQVRQEIEEKGLISYCFYQAKRFSEMIFSKLVEMNAPLFSWIDNWMFSASKKRLQRYMDKEKSLEDVLSTCENYVGYWYYKTIRAYQIPYEIKTLLKEVKKNGASVILDIGTFDGGTLYLWTRFLEGQKIITIDLPFPYGYPSEKTKLFRLFDPDKELHFMYGCSFSNETVNKVSKILKGDKIDFLFIDGDHSYEGARKDFEQYKPLMRDGGIIALHDIVSDRYGVSKLWNEIRHKYVSKEIIAPKQEMRAYARSFLDKHGWGGIGVLYV